MAALQLILASAITLAWLLGRFADLITKILAALVLLALAWGLGLLLWSAL